MRFKSALALDSIPVWLVVFSFGPYVFPSMGIRTEHIFLYSLLPFAFLILLGNRRAVFYDQSMFFIFVLVFMLTVMTLLSTIFGYDNIIDNTSIGKIISHLEKYLRPMATIIVLCAFFCKVDTHKCRKALINVSKALLYMLAINTLLVLIQLVTDISFILDYFTVGMGAANLEVKSVAELAIMMGRFTGVFNQPAESGLAYGLGLFAWAYLSCLKVKSGIPFKGNYLLLVFVILGGFFSISKIFIVVGFPLFILYLVAVNKYTHILNIKLFLFLLFGFLSIGYIIAQGDKDGTSRFYSLTTLMTATEDPVFMLTGGRFGNNDASLTSKFIKVWATDPLFGRGFASFVTLDSGYFEFFAQGGLICLIGFFSILIGMAWAALKNIKTDEGVLLMFVVIFISGAAVGMPPLTANRFSPIIWVFIVFIYFIFYSQKNETRKSEISI